MFPLLLSHIFVGSFQHRFLNDSHVLTRSSSVTSSFNTDDHHSNPSRCTELLNRPESSSSIFTGSTISKNVEHVPASDAISSRALLDTDPALFEAWLEFLYTGEQGAEGVHIFFEGFDELTREGATTGLTGVAKLREDLLYCWRSKLYADVSITLEDDAASTFASHRSILAARVPYFASMFLGEFLDAHTSTFTLPSPLFTSASFTFILGFVYGGTLHFSARKFDLSTAFDIWRGAAFLALEQLQHQVEASIQAMLTPARAARIYQFALAPDVSSARLAQVALPFVVGHFHQVWDSPLIGNLDYHAQKALVREVCASISVESITDVAKHALHLRKRLELVRHGWADHIRAMLDAVEDELVAVLGRDLATIVVSKSFIDLVDGVGFSNDALEYLLELAIRSLSEVSAPKAYQALVGSVLLREEGILIDAKVLIEDARNGVLRYIKRRYISIRNQRGFESLDPWCLKELADDISVSEAELLESPPNIPRKSPRAGVRRADPSSSASSNTHGSRSTETTAISRLPSAATALDQPRQPLSRPSRSSAVSSSSGSRQMLSRAPRGSAPAPRSVPAASPLLATAVSRTGASPRPRDSTAVGGQRGAPAPGTSTSATRLASPSSGPLNGSLRASSTAGTPPQPPRGRARSQRSPVVARVVSEMTSTAPRTRTSSNSSSATNVVIGAAVARRERSSSDAASGGAVPDIPPPPPRNRTRSAGAHLGSSSSARLRGLNGNVAATPGAIMHSGPAPKHVNTRSPSSSATPRSAVSKGPVDGGQGIRRISSAASVSSVRAPSARPASTSSSKSLRLNDDSSPSTPPPVPPLPCNRATSMMTEQVSSASSTSLPGTALLAGIPCIVTVAVDPEKECTVRFRAIVRYLGALRGGQDDGGEPWIGVEVAEAVITKEANALPWNDGSVDGIVYFRVSERAAKTAPFKGRTAPNARENLAVDSPSDEPSATSIGTPSLRPPSRLRRRSSSVDPLAEQGPGKGLFLRPHNIVYVL